MDFTGRIGSSDAKCCRRDRIRRHGEMGGGFQQTGRRRAGVALFKACIVLWFEPETLSRARRRHVLLQGVAEVADIRARMFTVCVRRYDQVRRAATYMRWTQDDVDAFVPSLYAKGPRQHKDPVVLAPPASPALPAAKPASPAVPVVQREEGLDSNTPYTS